MFDPRIEQVLAAAFGRPPQNPKMRSFMQTAMQPAMQPQQEMMQGQPGMMGQMMQGQQMGDQGGGYATGDMGGGMASTNPQANVKQDPIELARQAVMDAQKNIAKARERQIGKDVQLKVREELLKSPAIQMLLKAEGEADKKVSGAKTKVKPSILATATQQGALQGTDLANAVQRSGDIGRAFAVRGAGITDVINAISGQREQELQGAQIEQQGASSLLQSLIQAQQAEQEQKLFPLKLEQARLGIQTERLQQDKIKADIAKVEQGEPLSPTERLAYAKALGVAPNEVEAAIASGVNPADIEAQQKVAENQVKIDPRLKTIREAIPKMEKAVRKVNTSDSYFGQIQKYGPFAALRGKSPDIAELETFKSLRASLARLTGEVGNLSEGEQAAIGNAFIPEWTDSRQKAQAKITAINNFMSVLSSSNNPAAVAKDAANSDANDVINKYSGVESRDEIDLFLDSF